MKKTNPHFTPNGELLSEIICGGKIVSYHLFADRDFETDSQIGHILLELHKDRRSQQKVFMEGQPFPCRYVAYECMHTNGEWIWCAMTYYRSTLQYAKKGLREQFREETRRHRLLQMKTTSS